MNKNNKIKRTSGVFLGIAIFSGIYTACMPVDVQEFYPNAIYYGDSLCEMNLSGFQSAAQLAGIEESCWSARTMRYFTGISDEYDLAFLALGAADAAHNTPIDEYRIKLSEALETSVLTICILPPLLKFEDTVPFREEMKKQCELVIDPQQDCNVGPNGFDNYHYNNDDHINQSACLSEALKQFYPNAPETELKPSYKDKLIIKMRHQVTWSDEIKKISSAEYDVNGNLLKMEFDTDADSIVDAVYYWTYSDNLMIQHIKDTNADGVNDEKHRMIYNDASKTLIEKSDFDGDGVFDQVNRYIVITEIPLVIHYDEYDDGQIDKIHYFTFTDSQKLRSWRVVNEKTPFDYYLNDYVYTSTDKLKSVNRVTYDENQTNESIEYHYENDGSFVNGITGPAGFINFWLHETGKPVLIGNLGASDEHIDFDYLGNTDISPNIYPYTYSFAQLSENHKQWQHNITWKYYQDINGVGKSSN